jgi:ribonuclease-3
LEFLWDAVLWLIISKKLYSDYPNKEESDLTLYKISLVKQESLYNVAKTIWLDQQIILWKWEEKCLWRTKKSILEDSVEALIWYLFLDLWYDEVEKFIVKYIYSTLDNVKDSNFRSNKTLLQESVQKKHKIIPEYINFENEIDWKGNVIDYKAEVFVLWKKIWEWYWANKKTAQENAAKIWYNFILQN